MSHDGRDLFVLVSLCLIAGAASIAVIFG